MWYPTVNDSYRYVVDEIVRGPLVIVMFDGTENAPIKILVQYRVGGWVGISLYG